MSIYVNRVLNMKAIDAIGFDMDHTLVRYYSDRFEELTFKITIEKLIASGNYPKEELEKFKFDFNRAIRGLIVDKENGNILKVSLYNKIKASYHGTRQLTYKEQLRIYHGSSVDLAEEKYSSVDTTFSIAFTVIFSQLVQLKDNIDSSDLLPSYAEMADDVVRAVDEGHRDGTIKNQVLKHLDHYIIPDEEIVTVLERFKAYGKKLWIITNSDYKYTKALLDYTINPFLKGHKHWSDLFEITITLASKPRFFTDHLPFLKVNPETGMMENFDQKITSGIFQGGHATKLQRDLGLRGDQILYLGDHIYGDILKLKKSCDWRTALVLEELDREVKAYKSTKDYSIKIDELMEKKIVLEKEIDELYAQEYEYKNEVDKKTLNEKFKAIEKLDKELGVLIKKYESHFNTNWGEVMRAGAEPSSFALQIERYACIYMSKISDFKNYSPRNYYRPKKRKIAHEM